MSTTQPESGRILVVPSEEFDRLGRFQGFSGEVDRYLDTLLSPGVAGYRPRAAMEEDPSFKQIIPYVVIRCRDAFFCYRRGTSQGETRLHSKRSLGIGGHVEEHDADGRPGQDAYELALRRELAEEVDVRSPGILRRVGMINDDSTPVGQVHLGVVHVYELERPDVVAREEGLADGGFVALDEVLADRCSFETWSQIYLDALLQTSPRHGVGLA